MTRIPFNKPFLTGNEQSYFEQVAQNSKFCGDGEFTQKCSAWLEEKLGCSKALLTHSCTAALEMSAILAQIKQGDEVIMPSFTFVSTANAFVLRGGVPVFVDIRPDTLNINENLIEAAITPRTRAIMVVHYAGVACEMDSIMDIAERHNLIVIEDAAQALMSDYKGKKLGSIGHMSTFSFHETKNIISGEGGALIINDPELVERAEIIREKGTNRSQFFRGQVDKYSWVDLGSSYLPGEMTAAFLWAQLEEADKITNQRLQIWNTYDTAFKSMDRDCNFSLATIPNNCNHNAHMYYLLLDNLEARQDFIQHMGNSNIGTAFHYVPLHSSPFGKTCSRVHGDMMVTNSVAERLVRLPLWIGVEKWQQKITDAATSPKLL